MLGFEGVLMFKFVAFVMVVGGLSILSACATLNENECQTVNWQDLGESDGARGFEALRIAKHAKACEKFKIPVDEAAYQAGWKVGIARFCTPQNGYNLGIAGRNHRNACPPDLADAFLQAYTPAKRVATEEAEVRQIERNIEFLADEISKLALSTDKKDLEKLKRTRDRLQSETASLPHARANADVARKILNDFLRANPEIKTF